MPTKIAKTLAETFLEALTAAYPEDPSAPGIVVSFLGNNRKSGKFGYYVSVVRYLKPFGNGRHVALKSMRPTLDAALTECAEQWFAEHAPAETAIRALKKALKDRGVTVRKDHRKGWVQSNSEYYADPDPLTDAAEEATWD